MDLNYVQGILPSLWGATLTSLRITLLGMAVATVVGLPLAIGRVSRSQLLTKPIGGLIEFVRLTPLLVQVFFAFYILPFYGVTLSPELTGILVIGLHYGTFTSEVYRGGIKAVPRQQWEAAAALNFTTLQTWLRIILPQAVPPMIPALGNYLIGMFKDVPVLSVITVYELLGTAKLLGAQSFRYFETFTMVGLIFLALSYPASRLVTVLERRTQGPLDRAAPRP